MPVEQATPGPWRSLALGSMIIGPDNYVICRTALPADKNHDRQMANARLIVSAPDLLKALKRTQALLFMATDAQNTDAMSAISQALDAIHKAEGKAIEVSHAN